MERDRIIRVSDNLKKEIANLIINSDLKDQCGFMSINHVETSRDLSKAKVFFTTIHSKLSEKELQALLNNNAWRIRKDLSNSLPIKRVPELRFIYDDHLDNVRKIDSIIDEID